MRRIYYASCLKDNLFFSHERKAILEASGSLGIAHCKEFVDKTKPGKRIHRKTHGVIGFTDLVKHVGEKWRALDRVSRAYFKQMAELDKERYTAEVHALDTVAYGKQINRNGGDTKKSEMAKGATQEHPQKHGQPALGGFLAAAAANTAGYRGDNFAPPLQYGMGELTLALNPTAKKHLASFEENESLHISGLDIEPIPLYKADFNSLVEMCHGDTAHTIHAILFDKARAA